jgi:exopolysaccharide biosynthesis WecB/TagA/CpsF family protein
MKTSTQEAKTFSNSRPDTHTQSGFNHQDRSTNQSESQTVSLLGIQFENIQKNHALNKVAALVEAQKSRCLYFVNAHCLNVAYHDYDYRLALSKADLRLPDGSGISLGCKLNQSSLCQNLNGTDLFPDLCEMFESSNQSIYLLGAEQDTAEKVSQWVKKHYPNLRIAGFHHGHFNQQESTSICEEINRSGADVLFVAMGVPRQEIWLESNKEQLNTQLNIAVGGLFEFYSQNISRAPSWMRHIGVEWMWRLIQEPARMWKRYILGNVLYVFRVWAQIANDRVRSNLSSHLQSERVISKLQRRNKLLSSYISMKRATNNVLKRLMDITLSGAALLFLLPFLPVVAVLIKLDSPGGIFFKQRRAGIYGHPFDMWKFRSMSVNAEASLQDIMHLNEKQDSVMFKVKNDPRITKVGSYLRRFSIDELPQLWNVFIGDMSIVGPRPALYSEIKKYSVSQRERLDSKPGLTSEWAIKGRNNLSFEEQANLDVKYNYRRTFWQDCKLILKTIPIVLTGRGAS